MNCSSASLVSFGPPADRGRGLWGILFAAAFFDMECSVEEPLKGHPEKHFMLAQYPHGEQQQQRWGLDARRQTGGWTDERMERQRLWWGQQ